MSDALSIKARAAKIPLTQGLFALVDWDDFEAVMEHKWCAHLGLSTSYAKARVNGLQVPLHRFIMAPGPGLVVDHIDCDGLNNTRVNLRVCTQAENIRRKRPHRRSGLPKGVSAQNGRWRAFIRVEGKTIPLGSFKTPDEAAAAYNQAARKAWGDWAYQNPLPS